ncbi:hypothetical protein GP913_30355, partial [Enterobacteriaceae bacterium 8376wG6]|nr:hypothetical protein [Enterobacteriaceae bacterium 8376wG6]
MFDYEVSKHPHFDMTCRQFSVRHNLFTLGDSIGMRP